MPFVGTQIHTADNTKVISDDEITCHVCYDVDIYHEQGTIFQGEIEWVEKREIGRIFTVVLTSEEHDNEVKLERDQFEFFINMFEVHLDVH